MSIKKVYFLIFGIILIGTFLHALQVKGVATVLFPYQGGTGIGTGPNLGDLMVGSTTSAYGRFATGTADRVLRVSSTAGFGISWEYPLTTNSCTGSNKVSAISATGTLTCSTDETAASPESGWRINEPFTYLATSTSRVGIGATSTSDYKVYIQGTAVASTTLWIQGMTAQTGDLLRVASSGGTLYFQISNLGVVSSSEFKSTSGTIPNFWFTNATGTNLGITTIVATTVSSSRIAFVNATGTDIILSGSIGSSANRITKLWASDLDSTLGTIGTVTISSAVSGDLVVNNGDVNLASSTKAYRIGGSIVL